MGCWSGLSLQGKGGKAKRVIRDMDFLAVRGCGLELGRSNQAVLI